MSKEDEHKHPLCPLPKYRLQTQRKNKCLNYFVCFNHTEDTKEFCKDCNLLFGSWRGRNFDTKFKELSKLDTCPLCLRPKKVCVKRPSCKHHLCIDCFRLVYYGYIISTPVFPYLDKEDIYFHNIQNDIHETWMSDDLIKEYEIELNFWTDFNSNIWNRQIKSNLTLCFQC